jgi:hypothetical protein
MLTPIEQEMFDSIKSLGDIVKLQQQEIMELRERVGKLEKILMEFLEGISKE